MKKRVVITGAMGFIGSHTAKIFKQAGYHVIGIDIKDTIPQATTYLDQLFVDDFVYITADAAVANNVDAIIHCAGTSLVGPSIANPYTYYNNNSAKINTVLDSLHNKGWHGTVVFSSSAATYGIPLDNRQLYETNTQLPISPYGQSKLFGEHIIKDHCRAHGFRGIALRYFNAAGCDEDGTLGHVADDTHMIPRVLSAHRQKHMFNLYGNDYCTADGTCIRDYLHVTDIAQAHLTAVHLAGKSKPGEFNAYNLGTGTGHSNLEIIKACNRAVKGTVDFVIQGRRIGDPDYLVANSDLFQTTTGWCPVNSNIDNIVATAWAWEQKHGSQ